jgi:hypothetical protein
MCEWRIEICNLLFVKGKSFNDKAPPYVDLIPTLGAYDITTSDIKFLFDAAYDPLSMFGHFIGKGFRRRSISGIIDPVVSRFSAPDITRAQNHRIRETFATDAAGSKFKFMKSTLIHSL